MRTMMACAVALALLTSGCAGNRSQLDGPPGSQGPSQRERFAAMVEPDPISYVKVLGEKLPPRIVDARISGPLVEERFLAKPVTIYCIYFRAADTRWGLPKPRWMAIEVNPLKDGNQYYQLRADAIHSPSPLCTDENSLEAFPELIAAREQRIAQLATGGKSP